MEAARVCYSRRSVSRAAMENRSCEEVVEKLDVSVQKEDVSSKIELIKDDALDSMTVKELRDTARKLGISVSGNKKDMISKMKASLNGDKTDEYKAPGRASKRKGGPAAVRENVESSNIISEVTVVAKRSKRKQQSTGSVKDDGDFTSETTLKMTSVEKEVVAKVASEAWTVLAHKKPQAGWVAYNPKTMRPLPLGKNESVKLLSWNVNGLKALLKSGFSALQLVQREDFDVLCLQETKLQEKDVEDIKKVFIEGYTNSFWTCSVSKLGYSGTAIISRIKPISIKYGLGIPDHDSEGRVVSVEFDDFFLVTAYVPNSGDGLRRLTYRTKEWDPSFAKYLKELEKSKPVILNGDLNCSHQEMDIYDPQGNRRSAGFTAEERESFQTNFLSNGFVDTFRQQHPSAVGYTYWGYRHNARPSNKGWRLDYFLVSESIAGRVHDSYILPDVLGSDHCPVGLVLRCSASDRVAC